MELFLMILSAAAVLLLIVVLMELRNKRLEISLSKQRTDDAWNLLALKDKAVQEWQAMHARVVEMNKSLREENQKLRNENTLLKNKKR